jgi:hypothetical protein
MLFLLMVLWVAVHRHDVIKVIAVIVLEVL